MRSCYVETGELLDSSKNNHDIYSHSASDINDISSDINEFISDSVDILMGNAWNTVVGNLGQYASYLEVVNDLNDLLYNNQDEILKILSDFLSPDDDLDTNKLDEYLDKKVNLERKIENLECENEDLKKVPPTKWEIVGRDKKGEPIGVEVSNPAYNQAIAKISNNKNLIDNLTEELNETVRLINKINEFYDEILPMIESRLEELQSKVDKFIQIVDLIGNSNPRLLMRYLSTALEDDSNAYFYYDENGKPWCVYYANSHIIIEYLSNGEEVFRRWNPETGEFTDISIFDDENCESYQYGANQMSFKDNFDELIKDPFIWEEMQKYYPVDSFDSIDDAMEYYERYFNNITHTGCGYAAGANAIFKHYEGNESEFEKTFGFPMYTVNNDGNIDFNYEIMELKYFNYCWANKYSLEQMEAGQNISNGIRELFTKNVCTAADLRTLDDFLIEYGVSASSKTDNTNSFAWFGNDDKINARSPKKYNNNDALVYGGSGTDLYDMDNNLVYQDVGSHYMYIVDFTDDRLPIVSSWGRKFILDIKGEKISPIEDLFRYSYINFDQKGEQYE